MITSLILHHLNRMAAAEGIRILYACETGSRGWGFASPDSDYDIRFIYAHPRDQYLSINHPKDTITTIFEDGGEVLDFNGWELRKTLHHFRKSNASPYEWLQSPFIYQQVDNFREELWAMAPPFFNPSATIHHYLGICNNTIKTGISGDRIKIKKYFYILRPLLAAIWAAEFQTIPPMEFRPLLSQISGKEHLVNAIHQLWGEKEKAAEGYMIPLVPVIQEFIETEMARCKLAAARLEKPAAKSDILDIFFRKMLIL